MEFENEDIIKATILYHLKDIKKIADNLIKEGFIITKPTGYGLQVSLNKDKVKEIEEFIKIKLGFDF